MQKSADAFRTISEVADDLSLPQHVLRFWETRFPQIRPLKRAGGRRYYRPADISLLKAIRQLLYDDGYTIKGVQRLLKEQGARGLSSGAAAGVDWNGTADAGSDSEIEALPGEAQPDIDRRGHDTHVGLGLNRHHQRAAIEDALATVEECKRILDALLAPPR